MGWSKTPGGYGPSPPPLLAASAAGYDTPLQLASDQSAPEQKHRLFTWKKSLNLEFTSRNVVLKGFWQISSIKGHDIEVGRPFSEGMMPQRLKANLLQAHHRHIGQFRHGKHTSRIESSSQAGRQAKQISNHKTLKVAMLFPSDHPKKRASLSSASRNGKATITIPNPQVSPFLERLSMYKPSFLLRDMGQATGGHQASILKPNVPSVGNHQVMSFHEFPWVFLTFPSVSMSFLQFSITFHITFHDFLWVSPRFLTPSPPFCGVGAWRARRAAAASSAPALRGDAAAAARPCRGGATSWNFTWCPGVSHWKMAFKWMIIWLIVAKNGGS